MTVLVEVPTILRSFTDGQRAVVTQGHSLRAVLEDLDREYPGLGARILGDDQKLRRFVNIYINDEDVRFTSGLDATVRDGDVVTILPAVAGG